MIYYKLLINMSNFKYSAFSKLMAYALDISRLGIPAFDYAGEGFSDVGYYQEDGYEEQNYNADGSQEDYYGYASWRFNYAVVLLMFCILLYLAWFAFYFDEFETRFVIV